MPTSVEQRVEVESEKQPSTLSVSDAEAALERAEADEALARKSTEDARAAPARSKALAQKPVTRPPGKRFLRTRVKTVMRWLWRLSTRVKISAAIGILIGIAGLYLRVAEIEDWWPFEPPPAVRIDTASSMFNSPGNDRASDEYVYLVNKGDDRVDLVGWVLRDAGRDVNVLPNVTLDPGKWVRVHPGTGTDSARDIYGTRGRPVWDNSGDTVTLLDADGNKIDSRSYEDAPPPHVKVPSLVRLQQAQAVRLIQDEYLVPRVRRVESDAPVGSVVAQNPTRGTSVDEKTVIGIVVSKGVYKPPPPPPCDPNYDDCVPLVDYDLDCPDIGHSVRVIGTDVHRLDGDGNGYGCES